MGITIYNPAGTEVWNSDNVAGGVIADVRAYTGSESATLTYPIFAGRSVLIVPLLANNSASDNGVSADVDLGYPRVTVAAASSTRRFAVVVR